MFDQYDSAVQVIDGNPEKALNLRTVQIHRQDAIGSCRFDGIGTDAGSDGNSWLIFLVTLGIAEERDNGRNGLGTRPSGRINPEQ